MSTAPYKTVTVILSLALIGSIIWGISMQNGRNSSVADLDKERLKSEQTISEKLLVEKERDQSTSKADALSARNEALSRDIAEATKIQNDITLKLNQALAGSAAERRRYAELKLTNDKLQKQVEVLEQVKEKDKGDYQQLMAQLTSLEADNDALRAELTSARMKRFDQAIVEATRGPSNKLIVKARRAQKLNATIDVASEVPDPVTFNITSPRGIKLTDAEGKIVSRTVGSSPRSKRIEMVFTPIKKLQPGLYQIEVLSGSLVVGGLKVRLR